MHTNGGAHPKVMCTPDISGGQGHRYFIYKVLNKRAGSLSVSCCRLKFFMQLATDVWNSLPANGVATTNLYIFMFRVDLSKFWHSHRGYVHDIVYLQCIYQT